MGRSHLVLRWQPAPQALPLPPEVTVRALSPDDANAVGSLFYQAFPGSVDDECETPDDARVLADETLGGRWGELLWPGCLMAHAGDHAVAATIVVADIAHEGLPLLAFAVTSPAWARRGIGASLIMSSVLGLHEVGLRELHLAVLPGNQAVALYRRLGFVEADA